MPFKISNEHEVRQFFGWSPGNFRRPEKEVIGKAYFMKDEYRDRCRYAGREGLEGIYFKDPNTGWVFVQERRFCEVSELQGS